MGFEMSVVQSERSLDLKKLYNLRIAVNDNFDWYLGDEKEKRAGRFTDLMAKAISLTRDDVLASFTEDCDEDDRKFLESIEPGEFNTLLKYVIDSIGPYAEGNTHLNFEWDRLPGTDIYFCCSGYIYDLLTECFNGPDDAPEDFVRELEYDKVRKLAWKWKGYTFRLKLMKWIGYWKPEVADRMLEDFLEEHSIPNRWCTVNDLLFYRNALVEISRKLDSGRRTWLTYS